MKRPISYWGPEILLAAWAVTMLVLIVSLLYVYLGR